MTAFSDARTNLEAAVAASKTALANQDTAPQLALAFGRLTTLKDAAEEWLKAYASLQTITAASERDFDLTINSEFARGLRADVQAFLERVAGARLALVKLAERARLS